MPLFRPAKLVKQPDVAVQQADVTASLATETPAGPVMRFTPAISHTSPLTISTAAQVAVATGQLADLASTQAITFTTRRMIRIPGSGKRLPVTEPLPGSAWNMSSRLRHAIVLAAVLLVGMATLLSLTPLANGQNIAKPIFTDISKWVQAQQADWHFQMHMQDGAMPVAQNNGPATLPAPPPPPLALPKSAYIAIAQRDASNAGIPPDAFVRQINLESGFNPNAQSPGGAEGIAQFLPSTAAGLGIDPFNPNQALNAAAHVMAGYTKTYGGDYAKALAAYNGGSATVQSAINACGAANWMNCLPGQTRDYLRTIIGL